MGKRANNAPAKVAAKKTKVEAKADPAFTSVGDAVMEAEQIPERVREMLVEMLPFSLKFASDERHELQDMAVDMVEQTLHAKKSTLAATAATEDGALATLKASESTLGATVTSADAAVAAQKDVVEAKKTALEEATAAEKASAESLKTQQADDKAAKAALETMQKDKTAIDSAFAEHFPPIQEGEGKAHLKKLEPFLKKIEIESTLLTALPSTCAKSKEKRGTFDHLVLQELDKAFNAKIAALGEAIVAEGPSSAQREASVQAAEKDNDAKKAAREHAASESEAANKDLSDREAALANAKKNMDEFQPQVDEVTARLSDARVALANFEAGPLTNFASFKTRVAAVPEESPKKEPEPVAEEAPAEEAPAEEASAA